jgi:phosphoserine phosphatase
VSINGLEVSDMSTDRLETVVTAKLSHSQRQELAEIAAYHGMTESEILRKMITSLLTIYEDVKEQASRGASMDELVGRSTRLALTELIGRPPQELRQLADQFKEAAYQLAALMEGAEDRGGRK